VRIGRAVRVRLGRYEVPVSRFYRARFVDLDECARTLARVAAPRTILEIGCGDGQLAGPLLERFPEATYQGIDVAPEVGRLFRGDASRASFRTVDSRSFARSEKRTFELVLLVDVLHHVPAPGRWPLLEDVLELTAHGGHYALKDWVRSRTPAHLAAWASDRLLTGDCVQYFEEEELGGLVRRLAPADTEVLRARIPPRPNNLLLVYRRDDT